MEEKYPTSYLVPFNYGVTLRNMKKFDESQDKFMRSIYFFQTSPNANINLGLSLAHHNMKTETFMTLMFALTVYPEHPSAGQIISFIENMLDGSEQGEESRIKNCDPDAYEKLDLIIENKAALNRNYKLKTKQDYKIFRHLQLLIEKHSEVVSSNGFFSKYYFPLYEDILNEGKFDIFTIHILSGINNPQMQKLVKKNSKKLNEFHRWLNERIYRLKSERHEWMGSDTLYTFVYDENGVMREIYVAEKDKTPLKPLTGYSTFSNITVKGQLDENGEKTGTWYWYYPDGSLKEDIIFVKGSKEGVSNDYYPSGVKKIECFFKNDSLDGDYKFYYPDGLLKSLIPFKNGKRDGKGLEYYEDGTLKLECNYKDNKFHGEYKKYYPDGSIEYVEIYENDESQGEFKSYHPNGTLRREGLVQKDKRQGVWKDYYSNGALSDEIHYKDGQLQGTHKEYTMDKTFFKSANYVNDKAEGIVFENDMDEKRQVECHMKANKIQKLVILDKDEKPIKTLNFKNGTG